MLHYLFWTEVEVINLVGDDYNATIFAPALKLKASATEEKYETRPVRINADGRVNIN